MKVYLVQAESGEYDGFWTGIRGVFTSIAAAHAAIADMGRISDEADAAYSQRKDEKKKWLAKTYPNAPRDLYCAGRTIINYSDIELAACAAHFGPDHAFWCHDGCIYSILEADMDVNDPSRAPGEIWRDDAPA